MGGYDQEQIIYEEWRPVVDFPNYSVSNFGRVVNHMRNHPIAISFNEYTGYYHVVLWHEGKGKTISIHRLVAGTFIDNLSGGNDVNHLDGDKSNNFTHNLEWSTRSDNHKHAYRTGIREPVRAVKAVRCLETNKVFNSLVECAAHLGIGKSSISNCLSGRRKSVFGYTFEYV